MAVLARRLLAGHPRPGHRQTRAVRTQSANCRCASPRPSTWRRCARVLAETDAYLAEWRKADPVSVGDDLEAEADKAAADIDATYDRERLVALAKAGGKDHV